MKRRKHPQPEPDGSEGGRNSASSKLEELEGYVEMGMKPEALRLARQILAQKRISAAELEEVLRAVGVFSDPMKWMEDLETAWQRQPAAVRREANSEMLCLFAMKQKWDKAAHHAKLRMLRSPADLLFGMWTMLAKDRLEEAAKIARKARKALKNPEQDGFDVSSLLETMALYHARVGEWAEAFDLWSRAPRDEPLSGNAAVGRVELCLVKALALIREELETLDSLPPDWEQERILPGNTDGLRKESELELRKLQRRIERMLPAKRRLELGFDPAKA